MTDSDLTTNERNALLSLRAAQDKVPAPTAGAYDALTVSERTWFESSFGIARLAEEDIFDNHDPECAMSHVREYVATTAIFR